MAKFVITARATRENNKAPVEHSGSEKYNNIENVKWRKKKKHCITPACNHSSIHPIYPHNLCNVSYGDSSLSFALVLMLCHVMLCSHKCNNSHILLRCWTWTGKSSLEPPSGESFSQFTFFLCVQAQISRELNPLGTNSFDVSLWVSERHVDDLAHGKNFMSRVCTASSLLFCYKFIVHLKCLVTRLTWSKLTFFIQSIVNSWLFSP